MAAPDSPETFNYEIKRIRELFFSLNEALRVPDEPDKLVKLELAPMFGFNLEENIIGVNFKVFYHYPERPVEEILAEIRVETVFKLKDLKKYHNEQGILILPGPLITSFVSLAYTHARALFAQRLAGTAFQELILQVINPEQVARYFFGYMFNEEKEVIQTNHKGELLARKSVNVSPAKAKKTKTNRSRSKG